MHNERTPQSEYLLRLGRKILEPYTRLPAARAAMITGSSAEGVSDHYSDLDMTVYYDGELPSEEALAAIRESHGAPERAWLLGERADGNIAEAYELDGVQAQIGHATIAAWENDIAEVLERWNADTPLHKAMSGTLECVAVLRRRPDRRAGRRGSAPTPRDWRARWSRRGSDLSRSGTCRTRSTRGTRRCGISRSASRPRTPPRHPRRIESSLFHDVPVQEDAALRRPDADQAGAVRRAAGGFVPADAGRCRGVARSAACAKCWRWSSAKCRRWTSRKLQAARRRPAAALGIRRESRPECTHAALRRYGPRLATVMVHRNRALWTDSSIPLYCPSRFGCNGGRGDRLGVDMTGSEWIDFHWQRSSRNVQIDIPQPDHVRRGASLCRR